MEQLIIHNKGKILTELQTNFDKVKDELLDSLKKYEGLIYTDETISEAKKDMAELNKVKSAIETQRKDVKSLIISPYSAFEPLVKELTTIIDETRNKIKDQADVYDEEKRDSKKEAIRRFYDETIQDDNFTLESIFDIKWLNVAVSISKIKIEISTTYDNYLKEIGMLQMMNSDVEDKMIQSYFSNRSLVDSMAIHATYENNKKIVVEAQQAKKIEEQRTPAEKIVDKVLRIDNKKPENHFDVIFKVTTDLGRINALKEFFEMNQITWEKI